MPDPHGYSYFVENIRIRKWTVNIQKKNLSHATILIIQLTMNPQFAIFAHTLRSLETKSDKEVLCKKVYIFKESYDKLEAKK